MGERDAEAGREIDVSVPSVPERFKPVAAAVAVFLFVLGAVLQALTFSELARLVPLVVGTPVLILAGLQVFREIRTATGRNKPDEATRVDTTRGMPEDAGNAERLEGGGLAWVAAASVAVLSFGLVWGLTLFVVIFLRLHGRESWVMIASITIPLMVGLYFAFSVLLSIRLFEGLLMPVVLP